MASDKRRDRRHPIRTRVVVGASRQSVTTQTSDVSFGGVFIRMDCPPPERQLVQLVFTLPPEGDELALTGMVARVTPGKVPGVGLRFYAISPQALKRWQRFVRFAASGGAPEGPGAKVEAPAQLEPATGPKAAAQGEPPLRPFRIRPIPVRPPPVLAIPVLVPDRAAAPEPAGPPSFPTDTPDAVHRTYPRYVAAVQVRLQSLDELNALYTRNVSKGGAFIRTTVAVAEGSPVRLLVVHPQTTKTFSLEAVVRRLAPAPDPGLGVEFVQLTEQRRDEFFEFIRSQLPADDAVFVAASDPALAPAGPPPPPDDHDD
jgi:Tfp pilus assembly protein PilZ